MKQRKTYLKYINELGSMGFLNHKEHDKIKSYINARFNGMGLK